MKNPYSSQCGPGLNLSSLTRSEGDQRAGLVKPGEGSLAKFLHAGGGHRAAVGFIKRVHYHGELEKY